MGEPTILETERLRLEPFSERHLGERYVGWLNDPEVMRFSENRHRVHTAESCRGYWRSFAGTPHLLWAIVTRDTQLHIGNANAYLHEAHGLADIGILVGERGFWGKGVASEAWFAICDHLLRARQLRKLSAGSMASNLAMVRVMQKAGMREDGRRPAHYLLDGRPVDVLYHSVFREDWPARGSSGPEPPR